MEVYSQYEGLILKLCRLIQTCNNVEVARQAAKARAEIETLVRMLEGQHG